MDCQKKVRDWIIEKGLIGRGDHVTAAVSGGPDYMAMLSILDLLSGGLGFHLSAAYFDHLIRDDGGREKRIVEKRCERLGIPLLTGSADVPALAGRSKIGLEEAAREARYDFLDAARGLIALGHNSDDQVETVLHHIIRGSGLRGIAGMPVRRGRLIRPVMCCGGGELRRYCIDHGIRYAVDRSNRDTGFLRNRIRHRLIPTLERDFNPSAGEAVLRLAENAREGLEALAAGMASFIPSAASDGSVTIDARKAGELADYKLYLLVDSILRDRLGLYRDMTRKHFEAVSRLIRSGRSGRRTSLPHGVKVTVEHGKVRFDPPSAGGEAPPENIVLPGDGRFDLPGWKMSVKVTTRRGREVVPAQATGRSAALASVSFPVSVRPRRNGDRLAPFGMKGTKKLSDIMIDAKVPLRNRDRIPVFEDRSGILWIPGVAAAERTRITGRTRRAVTFELSPEN